MEKPSETEEQISTQKKSCSASSPLTLLALLIAIIAIAFSGWQWYNLKNQEKQGATLANQLNVNLTQTHDQLSNQQQSIESLQTNIQHLIKITGASNKTWKLAEAKYLLQLANYSLNFSQNVPLTIKLFQSADQRIASLGDPAMLELRRSLAHNIAALKAVPVIDTTGVVLKIDALSSQVDKLKIVPNEMKKPLATPDIKTSANNKSWGKLWQDFTENSWDNLKNVVIIRHLQKPMQPLVSPEQRVFLVANIRWQLARAQWAILHHNQALYKESLLHAENWISNYFTVNSTAKTNILNTITQLNTVNVQPQLPEVTSSLKIIEQLMKQPMQHTSPTKTKPVKPIKPEKNPALEVLQS